MSGAAIPQLRLGAGMAASQQQLEDSVAAHAQRRARSSKLTVYPVPDKPVSLDVVHWRRIRRKETKCSYARPQPRTNVQRCYGPELTEHLTRSYVLRGYHLRVLVAHNAEVCLRAGLEAMSHTWRMLGILLSGVPGGLLLPLGSSAPDIDVAGIDEGMAAAVAAAAASAGGGSGGGGAAGPGGRRNVDPAAAGDFSVPEVLDLIDQHEEEEEEDKAGKPRLERQLTPEQRQQQLNLAPPPPRQPGRAAKANRGLAAAAGGGGTGDLKLPPRRPAAGAHPTAVVASTTGPAAAAVAATTSSESVSSSSRHGTRSQNSATFSGGGGPPMWQPLPSRGYPPPAAAAAAAATAAAYTATTAEDEEDDGGDSDGGTTATTSFVTTESVWWEHDDRANRGGGGRGRARAGEAATRNGGGGGGGTVRSGRPDRQERLRDEVALRWLWKSEVRDWLSAMSEAGFAYDTLAVLEVVRSWYYGTGPGRDEGVEEEKASLEEMCDINDAAGFWLDTDIPNLQVRMWYMQGLEKLWQLQLYAAATDIINHCGDRYIAQMHLQNTTLYPFCSGCGTSRSTGTSTWCNKCARQASLCAVCDLPVVGLYIECPGCHHGGHAEHMMNWFAVSSECPVETCSHVCRPRLTGTLKPEAAMGTAAELRQWQEFHSSLRLSDR